ncbi:MAG: SDR family oxidoreductase [Chitinophagaceae bacterium]|nr:SDR family oxidoreductase [Chitinophagaceae bacterium]MCZ2395443.1 SDR family oxidoreductase [Chitinophagales bacterium]
MFDLKNKAAIVTGSGSGIGRATAITLAGAGALVYVADINSDNAGEVVNEIKSKGGNAEALVCDVTDQADVRQKYGTVERLDILVNCAGISQVGTATSTSEADFDKVFKVNVKGVYNSLHVAIPIMKKTGGVIINICSAANRVGIPDRFAYSMTKGAVDSMTLSVAKDYIKDGIRCNSISPARVHTPFVDGFLKRDYPGREAEMFKKLEATQPIGRMAKPEEIAALILYLSSDEASFITGTDYPIDGGFIKLNN